MSEENNVYSVGEARLEVTNVHLVIVMVEQLAKLGDLEKKKKCPMLYIVI